MAESALVRLAPEGVPFVATMTLNVPAMAAAALPMIAPLIVAGRMISGARHNPE